MSSIEYNKQIDINKQSRDTEIQSINANVDQKLLEKKLLDFVYSNKNLPNDEYSQLFINHLIKNQIFIFQLNKHEEIFCNYKINNLKEILNYLIFRFKFRFSAQKKFNFDYPLYLLIEPVSTCNLRCPFCFQTDKTFTKKPYMGVMDFELFKKVVDEANDIGVRAITLGSRGEPTLHKKFAEMVEYISSKENIYELKINTNATFLNDKISKTVLKNNVNQIIISADHYIREDYERLRLGAIFDNVVDNVDKLYNLRKTEFPNSITEIRISGVDNEKNLDREKFSEFWLKRSDHVVAQLPLERWNTYENEIIDSLVEPCEYLWDRMYVWFDGKVNPCDADYKSYLSYGNVKEKSIYEIWNGDFISKIRQDHLNGKRNEINPCNKCGVEFN
tara:strand:- start:3309 stop:4475 length:1167 start_codon:yes stop_codon:yes gene_type:complete